MRSFRSDPYLWVHLAGIAAVPILLEFCLLGLAVSHPFLPTGLEFLFVGLIGVAPVLWMQWQRPFSIFSLVAVALKPEQLTDDQRRILQSFKAPLERILAVVTAILLLVILWRLYQIAPIASEVTPFAKFGRVGGILVAAIAFLGSNLFFQVPVSVLRVLLTPESQMAAMEPYPVEGVTQDFTLLGIRVKQILPNLVAASIAAAPVEETAVPEVAPIEAATATPPEAIAEDALDPAPTPAAVEAADDDFEDELEDDFEDEPEAALPVDEPTTAIAEPLDADLPEHEVVIELPEEAIAVGLEIPETDTVLIEIASETGEMTEVVVGELADEETIAIEITVIEDESAAPEPEILAAEEDLESQPDLDEDLT